MPAQPDGPSRPVSSRLVGEIPSLPALLAALASDPLVEMGGGRPAAGRSASARSARAGGVGGGGCGGGGWAERSRVVCWLRLAASHCCAICRATGRCAIQRAPSDCSDGPVLRRYVPSIQRRYVPSEQSNDSARAEGLLPFCRPSSGSRGRPDKRADGQSTAPVCHSER